LRSQRAARLADSTVPDTPAELTSDAGFMRLTDRP
jgi:hypothetical protein